MFFNDSSLVLSPFRKFLNESNKKEDGRHIHIKPVNEWKEIVCTARAYKFSNGYVNIIYIFG